MAKITERIYSKIMADHHVGISQNALAKKYELSPATINKIVKGIDQKNVKNVEDLARIKVDLLMQTEVEAESVHREVDRKTRDLAFFREASLEISRKALDKLRKEDMSMFDLEKAQNIIGKGKDNIYGKTPETAIQINNQQAETKDITPDRPQVSREEWLKLHGVGK